ncbi:hypothetical protein HGRIS_004431 [Hohenbuehelia grisea]
MESAPAHHEPLHGQEADFNTPRMHAEWLSPLSTVSGHSFPEVDDDNTALEGEEAIVRYDSPGFDRGFFNALDAASIASNNHSSAHLQGRGIRFSGHMPHERSYGTLNIPFHEHPVSHNNDNNRTFALPPLSTVGMMRPMLSPRPAERYNFPSSSTLYTNRDTALMPNPFQSCDYGSSPSGSVLPPSPGLPWPTNVDPDRFPTSPYVHASMTGPAADPSEARLRWVRSQDRPPDLARLSSCGHHAHPLDGATAGPSNIPHVPAPQRPMLLEPVVAAQQHPAGIAGSLPLLQPRVVTRQRMPIRGMPGMDVGHAAGSLPGPSGPSRGLAMLTRSKSRSQAQQFNPEAPLRALTTLMSRRTSKHNEVQDQPGFSADDPSTGQAGPSRKRRRSKTLSSTTIDAQAQSGSSTNTDMEPLAQNSSSCKAYGRLFRNRVTSAQTRTASLLRRKKPGKYLCEHCETTFTALHNLNRHRKAHKGKSKNYKCPCGKSYTTAADVRRHQKNSPCQGLDVVKMGEE